jgi:hypothetical protein
MGEMVMSTFADRFVVRAAVAGFVLLGIGTPQPAAAQQQPEMSFKNDVFPILKGRCMDCHSPGGVGHEKSGLDLRTYEGLMKGTKFGPMVVPGDPDTSNLMVLLDWRAAPEVRMPFHARKLSTCDRDDIRRWIRQGAQNN